MFRSKTREESHQEHLTGLERAKLERLSPQPAATLLPAQSAVLPPHPPVAERHTLQAARPAAVLPSTIKPAVASPQAATFTTAPVAAPVSTAPVTNQSQMMVGPGVVLKGNVLNCEVLRVEGTVEGDVKARKVSVSNGGALLGTADVEEAEIEGRFEGTLAVAGLLLVQATGRLSGKFSYGTLEIKRGGELTGEMEVAAARPRARTMEVVRQPEAPRGADPAAKAVKTA